MPRYTKYNRQMMSNIKGFGLTKTGSVYDWILRLDLDNLTEKQKQTAVEVANMNSGVKAKRAIYNDEVYKVCVYPKYWMKKDGKWCFIKHRKNFPKDK